jgi:GAF domain-containing protein
MPEELNITAITKEDRYKQLLPQVSALLTGEDDLVANLANFCGALKYGMNFFWVGFYLVKQNELVLGPFQGPVACTRIQKGKGVCGAVWEKGSPIVVEDVDNFPGHIACSPASRSEIVLPLVKDGVVTGVLDVDSDVAAAFDATDELYLTRMLALLKFKTSI